MSNTQNFSEKLGDLLAEFANLDCNTLISAMELQIMALEEECNGK